MANICDNTFYAYSENRENISTIVNFFKEWYGADIEDGGESVDVHFDSRWVFPEEDMDSLYKSIPDKDSIYMRCLSVEYGMDYVAYWKCFEDGWHQEV